MYNIRSWALLLMMGGTMVAKDYRVYVGTYTRDGSSQGIYTMQLNPATGKVTEPVLAAKIANPSFLTVHPNRKWVYAVSEEGQGPDSGTVSAFSVDPRTGSLAQLNTVKSKGSGPCYVSVDSTGKYVFVANYGSGSIAALPIQADGKLGDAASSIQYEGSGPGERQKGPHAHSIRQMPTTNLVMSADLGTDKLMIFRFDAKTGKLTPSEPAFLKVAPGAGPRHFAFHPKLNAIYVNGEMASTVTAFAFDSKRGTGRELGSVSTLPADFKGNTTTAETVVHPNGKFLYCSNRGHDSIAVFQIQNDSTLKPAGQVKTGGETPRNFNIDPSGKWLLAANQKTNDIHVFRIDQTSGQLTPTGQILKVGAPVCIRYTPER